MARFSKMSQHGKMNQLAFSNSEAISTEFTTDWGVGFKITWNSVPS